MQQPEASLAIQVLPTVQGDGEVVRVVDAVIAHLKAAGLNATVGPFETTVEGDLDTVCALIKECVQICVREGAPQVAAYLKLFYNPGNGVMSIEQKVAKHRP